MLLHRLCFPPYTSSPEAILTILGKGYAPDIFHYSHFKVKVKKLSSRKLWPYEKKLHIDLIT
jgi:hypothetical protein